MSTPKPLLISSAEYLERERNGESRSEYIDGAMYPILPPSDAHITIVDNFARELMLQMKGRPCRAFTGSMRVKVTPVEMYTYPDVVGACGNGQFDDDLPRTLLDPTVIVEVLSSSSEALDRGVKFTHSHDLESLQEYVLVSQDAVRVEHFVREGDRWILSFIRKVNGHLLLPSIACDVAIAQIYDNVELTG